MRSWKHHIGFWFVLVLSLSVLYCCDTERNVENPDLHYFIKYYGGDGNQQGVDMAALSDGSFLLLGNYSQSDFDTKVFLVRVDAEGEVIWERKFTGGPIGDWYDIMLARDLEPTNDGNFVILYDFRDDFGDSTNFKLLKISPDGTLLDSTLAFGEVANDYSRSVTTLRDGGFMVCGTTEFTGTWADLDNPDPDLGDIFVYRFDQNMDIDATWGPLIHGFGSHLDVAVKTFQKLDSGYYLLGYTNSQISGGVNGGTNPDAKLGLFYLDLQEGGSPNGIYYPGNLIPANDTEINFVHDIPSELGSGFLVLGSSQNQLNASELVIAKMRTPLVLSKQNDIPLHISIPLGRNVRGVSASSARIGGTGFLIVGNEIRSSSASNIWISKIDQSGVLQWSSTFGSEAEDDRAAAVRESADGKIVVLGTMGLADNQSKMAFIKLNPTGQLLK